MTFSLLKKTFKDPETKTVNYIGKQAESNYDEIHIVRAETAQLQSEFDLMRAMLIKFNRKMENMQSEVTYLKARPMRDNFRIHNFPYKQCEIAGHTRRNQRQIRGPGPICKNSQK